MNSAAGVKAPKRNGSYRQNDTVPLSANLSTPCAGSGEWCSGVLIRDYRASDVASTA